MLFHHTVLFSGMSRDAAVDDFVYRLADSSWFGVDLFFVLSGFLITGILYETKGSSRYFRSFYGRRVLRIFPLYYGFLAGLFLILPRLVWPRPGFEELAGKQVWYWTDLVNVDVAWHGWPSFFHIGHFWSLAVEEQFYLLWPLVLFLCSRRRAMHEATRPYRTGRRGAKCKQRTGGVNELSSLRFS